MDMLQITDLAEKQILLNFDDYQLSHINLVQGDTLSRPFVIQIIGANGEFYSSNPDIQCRLMGVNSNYPDKTYISIGTTFGDAYKVYVTTDMVSRAGTLSLQIGLYDGDTALIQSDVLDVDVNDSLMTGARIGGDGVLDFMELQAAIVNVEILEENYNKSLDEQKVIYDDIIEKHEHTVELEAELSDVFETEQSRVEAEKTRAESETQRIADEDKRKSQEATRQSEETERQTAEDKRIADEKTRQSNETTRKSQETARQSAEEKRASAETIRDDNEETRKSNEVKREKKEGIRQSQEKDRVTAEEERKAVWETWDTTMEGINPPATENSLGAVKVSTVDGEETPHTVPTVGKITEDMATFKDGIVADNQSFKDDISKENAEFKDKIDQENEAFKSEVEQSNQSLKDTMVSENNALKEEITTTVDTKMTEIDSKMAEVDTKIDGKLDTSALTFVESGKTYLAKFAVENGIPKIIANEVV